MTTLTIAQAEASSATSGLVVADTAANIAAGLTAFPNLATKVASFTLSAAGTLTAAQAEQLAGLGNKFHLGGYGLTVSDSLANVLASGNSAGVALATSVAVMDAAYVLLSAPPSNFTHVNSVTLTGSPVLSVAQVSHLLTLPHFSIGTTASVTLNDTASNISAAISTNPAWFHAVSTIDVHLDSTGLGPYASTLVAAAITAGKSVTFIPSSTVTSLIIAGPAQAIGTDVASLAVLAAHVTLSYTLTGASTVTAAAGAGLAGLASFAGHLSAVTVSDTAANVAAHAAGVFGHGFTAIDVTSGNLTTTAANLLAANLQLQGASATLSTSATLTAAQTNTLTALHGFTLGQGATITVQDTLAHLEALSNATLLYVTTTELPTGASLTLTAAQADTLAAVAGFTNTGASITVADSIANLQATTAWSSIATAHDIVDTAANILTNDALALVTGAAAVTLSANATVTAANAAALYGLPDFSHGSYALIVQDSAANLTTNITAVEAIASVIDITGTSTVTAAAAETLATLSAATIVANGAQVIISDTYFNITSGANAAGYALATGLTINDTGANLATAAAHNWGSITPSYVLAQNSSVTAAQLTTLEGLGNAFIPGSYTLTLADTVAHVIALTSTLRNDAAAIAITDTAADVTTAALNTITGYALSVPLTIKISDNTNHVSVTTATYGADTAVIDDISYVTAPTTANPGAVTVTGSYAQVNAIAGTIAADSHIGAVAITDTVANLTLNVFNTLQAAYNATPAQGTFDKALTITLSNPGVTLSVSATEYGLDAATIDDVQNATNLVVTGSASAVASIATTLAIDTKVTSVVVTDTAANLNTNVTALTALASKLTLDLSASGTVSAATLNLFDSSSHSFGAFTLSLADTVANVIALSNGVLNSASSIAITDVSTNLTAAALTTLTAYEATVGATPLTITFNDTGKITVTAATYTADSSVIDDITNAGAVVVSDAAAAIASIAATLLADTKVGSVAVTDTAANINTNVTTLSTLGAKLASITLTGGGAVKVATVALFQGTTSFTQGAYTYTIADTIAHVVAASTTELGAVASVAISDLSSNMTTGDLNTLTSDQTTLGVGHALSITFIGAGTVTVTAATYTADAATIGDITNTGAIVVAGTASAIAAIAATLAADTKVSGVAITDTAANISTNITALSTLDLKISSITLNGGGAVTIATIALFNSAGTFTPGVNSYTIADTIAHVVAASTAVLGSVASVAITDVTSNMTTAALTTLTSDQTTLGIGHTLSITFTDSGILTVTAATYSANTSVIDDITNSGQVAVIGNAAAILPIATTLKNDATVGVIEVADAATTIVGDLSSLLAIGSKLSVTLTDTLPIAAANVPQLVQLSINNPSAIIVADTGSNLASVIESASAATLTFLEGAVVELSGNSTVTAADAAALEGLSSFALGGYTLAVYDTYSHLTSSLYASALSSAKVSAIYLNTNGAPATLTAANMLALLALPHFAATTPGGSSDSITISDTAAHFASAFTTLQADAAQLSGIALVVNTSATITDAVLTDLQTLGATAANGVTLSVRDTAATIAANEAIQSGITQSITPTAWNLSASAAITLAQAEILGTTTGFSAGSYKLTVSQPTSAVISVAQANALGTLGSALVLTGGGQLDVQGTVSQLSALSANALAIVTPQVTDTLANFAGLTNASGLLSGTIAIDDSESVGALVAGEFFGLIKVGAGAGIAAANVSFGTHTETVTDTIGNLQSDLTSLAAYTGNPTLASAFTVGAADTVANLVNSNNLTFLEGLASTTLVANATSTASAAESLFLIESEIHFSKGGNTLTVADNAANLINPTYSDGIGLADTLHLSANSITTAAGAETLLGNSKFALTHVLTIKDTAANLLDGTLGALLAAGDYGSDAVVELSASTIVDATTATDLAALSGFADPNGYLTISDDPAYLIASSATAAETIAASVTIPGNETVSAATVLKLSEVPHFTAGAHTLTLAANDVADAPTLAAIGSFGSSFNDGGYNITMTADDISLTPAAYNSLLSDNVVTNGHLFGAVAATPVVSADTEASSPTRILTLTTPYAANGTYQLYDASGNTHSSTPTTSSTNVEQVSYTDSANNFSLTEHIGSGAASAPVVLLDTATITSAITTQSGSYAGVSGANTVFVGGGEYLPVYTTATLPGNITTSALVYDATLHTLSLATTGHAETTLITLGGTSFPTALTASEITVKTFS